MKFKGKENLKKENRKRDFFLKSREDPELPLEVIYCDNHLLVVNKPGDLLTQPDPKKELPNLEDLAKEWLKKKFSKKGKVFLHAIHRLDRPASGLILFARTSKALSRLNEESRNHKILRFYNARVWGHMKEKEGVLEHLLIHKKFHSKVLDKKGAFQERVGEEKAAKSKESRLSYQVIEEDEKTSLLEICLETGRYHQIRAQLAFEGHPIVGDGKYGSPTQSPAIALHHFRMEFFHPTTKEQLVFCKNFI